MVILNDRGISAEIVESCGRGDRDAFRTLYGAYKDRVYSIALYFFHGDAAQAGDATQQVFLKLMTSMAQFRGQSDFATWLYRVVTSVCMDGARRRAAQREAPEERLAGLAGAASQEEDLAREEIAGAVRAAVSSLPPKLRLPVLLRYFDELSYEQMASALACSVGTVSSRLSRGHRMLAGKLAWLRRPDMGQNVGR